MQQLHTDRLSRARLPLAVALAIAAGAVSAAEAGLVEDTTATLTARNFYMNRNFVGSSTQDQAEEWTQSFILDARSGFTQGTVGLGVDVLGLYALKLDGGKGTRGTQLLPVHDDGRPPTTSAASAWPARCACRRPN